MFFKIGSKKIGQNLKPLIVAEISANHDSNLRQTLKLIDIAKEVKPSKRGELEITSINQSYLNNNLLDVELMHQGMAWLDTGTFDSLYEACGFIQTLEKRQGFKVGCPEEVAWRKGWISNDELKIQGLKYKNSGYGDYLSDLLKF